ncbi:HotDog domain-containing protein [Aspergillus germanicus]
MSVVSHPHEFPPQEVSWLQRDVLLFANSIGVKANDLHFLYELHPRFCVFPTYPLILPFKLTDQEVIEFYSRNALNTVPGAPPSLDLRYAVDGQRKLTILKPLPTSSAGRRFELRNQLIGVYDKGASGSSIETAQCVVDADSGDVYAVTRTMNFLPGQGNWGGERGPRTPAHNVPNRPPDARHTVQTSEETVFLYRLNGDYNPLHAVPDVGKQMGLGGVIIHGLFTWSSACYGVLHACCGGGERSEPRRLQEIEARFAAPVRPGDTVVTEIWRETAEARKQGRGVLPKEEQEQEEEEVAVFRTVNQDGVVVLSNGRAVVGKREREISSRL